MEGVGRDESEPGAIFRPLPTASPVSASVVALIVGKDETGGADDAQGQQMLEGDGSKCWPRSLSLFFITIDISFCL